MWLSGLSSSLQTKGLPVRFPLRAHAWVVSQVPIWGRARDNYIVMVLSLSFSLPSLLSKNKQINISFLKNRRVFVVLLYERLGLLVFVTKIAEHKLFNFELHKIKYSSHVLLSYFTLSENFFFRQLFFVFDCTSQKIILPIIQLLLQCDKLLLLFLRGWLLKMNDTEVT